MCPRPAERAEFSLSVVWAWPGSSLLSLRTAHCYSPKPSPRPALAQASRKKHPSQVSLVDLWPLPEPTLLEERRLDTTCLTSEDGRWASACSNGGYNGEKESTLAATRNTVKCGCRKDRWMLKSREIIQPFTTPASTSLLFYLSFTT